MKKVSSLLTNFIDSVGQKLGRKSPIPETSGSFSSPYKNCQWCGDTVNAGECFAMYTGVSLICEICGKDVTGKNIEWEK
jgi:hypothetical protein